MSNANHITCLGGSLVSIEVEIGAARAQTEQAANDFRAYLEDAHIRLHKELEAFPRVLAETLGEIKRIEKALAALAA
jgi:hypothetical protein